MISFIYSCRIAEISRNNLRLKFSFHSQDNCQFEEHEKNLFMIRLLAGAKLQSIIFSPKRGLKSVQLKTISRTTSPINSFKTNVWISCKLRKSKNSNKITVLLWLRQSRKKNHFFKTSIYTLQIGITPFPVSFEASLDFVFKESRCG